MSKRGGRSGRLRNINGMQQAVNDEGIKGGFTSPDPATVSGEIQLLSNQDNNNALQEGTISNDLDALVD